MPLHEKTPGSKDLVFVHPKNGKFVVDLDGEEKEFSAIEGTLERVSIEFDEGSAKNKIQPYDAFIMHISDEENTYRIKINSERNFAISVGRVLGDLQKGDKIIAKTKQGDDPTVTFCNILKQDDEGKWVRPAQAELPADRSAKVEFLKKVVASHPANPDNKS